MNYHTSVSQQQSVLPLLLVAALYLLFFLFNPQVIADWRVYSFDDGTYSHAYLMVLVIGFLYWRAWRQQQLLVRWNPWFFLLLVASLLLYMWLSIAQLAFFSRIALPLVLAFTLASLFRVNASVLVPLSLVWFITPIWNALNGPLQKLSVIAVNRIMSLTDVPTLVEGNFVHIPSGTFEIAGGCSGLRYLITALALSVIYSFLNLRRKWAIAVFLLAAIAGALVTNWVRIALLIYIGHVTEMQSGLIKDHNMFGWYIFLPLIVLLFYLGTRLEPHLTAPAPLTATGHTSVLPFAAVALALALLSGVNVHLLQFGTLRWVAPVFDVESERAASEMVAQPTPVVYAWTRRTIDQVESAGVRTERQHYVFAGETDAHKADFYMNNPVPRGWTVVRSENSVKVARLLVSAPGGELAVIVYTYRIGAHQTTDPGKLRCYRLLEALSLNQRTELLWAMAYCGDDGRCEEIFRKLDGGNLWSAW